MIENFDTKMWLGFPINFHNICTIYPLTIRDYLVYSDIGDTGGNGLSYNALFTQFMINHDFLKDAGVNYDGDIFGFFFLSNEQMAMLLLALRILTHEENMRVDVENQRIYFDKSRFLSSATYPEFSDIVLRAHCFGHYQHVEHRTKTVKDFKRREDYERWKKLQANRAKYQNKDELNIAQCIKYIQLSSSSYIPDDVILNWTYWKMLHWYNATILQSNYDEMQQCFAHWGGKDLRKSLEKLKQEIMTKV